MLNTLADLLTVFVFYIYVFSFHEAHTDVRATNILWFKFFRVLEDIINTKIQ